MESQTGNTYPSDPMIPKVRAGSWLVLSVLGTACLAWHASTFLPFLADDALISLRYSERLVEGKGLTWTDGERVEGYSNLLWVLAAAALHWLGMDSILAVRLLGLLGMGAAVFALAWSHRRPMAGEELPFLRAALPSTVGVAALALSGPLAVWLVGGLEQPFVAGLLAWALAFALPLAQPDGPRRVLPAAIPLALLCLTRPDGALYTATTAIAVGIGRGVSLPSARLALRLCLLPAAAYLGQLAFRLAYYGDYVPNPARVKVAFTTTRLLGGLKYTGNGFLYLSGLTLLGLLALAAVGDPRRRRRLLLVGLPLLAWAVYLSVVGGEIFPGRRHIVPVAVLLAFLAAEGLAWAAARSTRWAIAGGATALVCLGLLLTTQIRDPENTRAREERWNWAGEPVGRVLHAAFADVRPLVAVNAAGCLPYWSRLPSLDMLGLNDRWIAMHPPEDVGHGHFAHEFGNGAYVYSRRPDIVILCGPRGSTRGCFRGDRELLAHPGFQRDYQLVTVEGRVPFPVLSKMFFRKESDKVGIRRSAERIHVPGWLLASTEGSFAAYLDDEKRLVARLVETIAGRTSLEIPPGRWRLGVDADRDEATLVVQRRGRIVASAEGLSVEFESTGGDHRIEIRPKGKTLVRGIDLRPVPAPVAEGSP